MRPDAGRLAAIALALGLAAAVLGAPGCGTDAVGVEACRSIETARCKNAQACQIDLTNPVHRDTPAADVDNCILFYRDACLHGLMATTDPGTPAVNACVARINTGDCTAVKTPEQTTECAFLNNVADAAAPADAAASCPAGCNYVGPVNNNAANACASPNFLCVCTTGVLPTTPANCTVSSIPVSAGVGYCCS
jgi:hypothetical protein